MVFRTTRSTRTDGAANMELALKIRNVGSTERARQGGRWREMSG
jgi:hypothetical protein